MPQLISSFRKEFTEFSANKGAYADEWSDNMTPNRNSGPFSYRSPMHKLASNDNVALNDGIPCGDNMPVGDNKASVIVCQ